jgi:hypothetical protein
MKIIKHNEKTYNTKVAYRQRDRETGSEPATGGDTYQGVL